VTQRVRLRDLDARITARFAAAGLADAARYTPPTRGAVAIAGTALVNRSVEPLGLESRVLTNAVEVTLFLGDLGVRPIVGGRIEVLDAASTVTDTFTVTDVVTADESRVVCLCKEGA
jgi:hypothetical protein